MAMTNMQKAILDKLSRMSGNALGKDRVLLECIIQEIQKVEVQ